MKQIGKKVYPEQSRRVFVGMSGGVDSSVSAALLKDQGYDVTGVFLKVWSPDWLPCTWKEERRDAMRVAAALDIPFITIDLEQEYKKGVVDYMLDEYKKGRTPNPDVMCNKEVKFGHFLKKALAMGADFIATGHYARIAPSPGKEKGLGDEAVLLEGADKTKDQSYFLWTLGQHELSHTLFPVGHLQKSEVRARAKKYKLPTADKKDSQGICFIGKVDMKEFLSHYIDSKPGDVVNEQGEKIGTHEGAVFYTIGQRHGFEITQKSPTDTPWYVVAKDIEKNILVVSTKNHQGDHTQAVQEVSLSNIHIISKTESLPAQLEARIRYRQQKQIIRIEYPLLSKTRDFPLLNQKGDQGGIRIHFSKPQDGVSIGQSLVFYDGEKCLGGGIIESVKIQP